jgi:hypothetical protein
VRSVEDSLVIARPALLAEHPPHSTPVQDVRKADDSEAPGTNPPSSGSKRRPRIYEVLEHVGGDQAIKGSLLRRLARNEALSRGLNHSVEYFGRIRSIRGVDLDAEN